MKLNDTHIYLGDEETELLDELKHSIYNSGFKKTSKSKIIRYAIRIVSNENKESMIKRMGAMNLL